MSLSTRITLIGSGAEGTAPTLLLTTHKIPRYGSGSVGDVISIDAPPAAEAIWFNVCECACRVANAAHVRLASTRAVAFTRAAPALVAGLPSLVFHLSDGGAGELTVVGGEGLAGYVATMGTFVSRRYPVVTVEPLGTGISTRHTLPNLDSRAAPSYAGWGGGTTGKIGVRVWAIPIDSEMGTGSVGGGGGGTCTHHDDVASAPATAAKRPRSPSPPNMPEPASCACFLVAIAGPAAPPPSLTPGVATDITTEWLAIIDVPCVQLSRIAADRITSAMQILGIQKVPTAFHLTCSTLTRTSEYATIWAPLANRHILCSERNGSSSSDASGDISGDDAAWGEEAVKGEGDESGKIYSFFPAATRLTIANHSRDASAYPLLLPLPRRSLSSSHASASASAAAAAAAEARVIYACPLDSWCVFPLFRSIPRTKTLDIDVLGLIPYFNNSSSSNDDDDDALSKIAAVSTSDTRVNNNVNAAAELRAAMRATRTSGGGGGGGGGGGNGSSADAGAVPILPQLSSSSSSSAVLVIPASTAPPLPPPHTPTPAPPRLFILGTGAAAPGVLRSCSAALLDLRGNSGSLLIDCGEGTLGKLSLSPWTKPSSATSSSTPPHFLPSLRDLRGVFISHLHADHHTGLLTLLAAHAEMRARAHDPHTLLLASSAVVGPLAIFGPPALLPILNAYASLTIREASITCRASSSSYSLFHFFDASVQGTGHTFTSAVNLLNRGGGCSSSSGGGGVEKKETHVWRLFTTESVRVDHCRDSFGVAFTIRAMVAATSTATPVAISSSSTAPRVLLYSGDTRPCSALVALGSRSGHAAGVQTRVTLLHEATFSDDRAADALRKRHSTTGEARGIAVALAVALKSVGGGGGGKDHDDVEQGPTVTALILTHFSQRYTPGESQDLGTTTNEKTLADDDKLRNGVCALDLLCVNL